MCQSLVVTGAAGLMCVCVHLVEDFLQVRGAHAVGQVSVGGVGQEELPLSLQRCSDVLLPVDVLLAAVDHANVT